VRDAAITALRRLRHGKLKALGPIWRSMGRLYRRVLRVTCTRATITTVIGPYGPFRLNGMFAFSDFEHWGGGHNDAFEACVEACRGRHCIIDVGAHIGLVALPMASVVAPDGRVYCFEPAECNRRLLLEHMKNNHLCNIEVLPLLLGASDEPSVNFFEMNEPTGMNTIVPSDRQGYRKTSHPQVSLDSFCAGRSIAPDIIKIDVEGAEVGVLRGARQTILRHRPSIFLSVHPRHLAGVGESVANLAMLIGELGYDCFDAKGNRPKQFELREYILQPRPVVRLDDSGEGHTFKDF
jgi:FkbM family methyltransferase